MGLISSSTSQLLKLCILLSMLLIVGCQGRGDTALAPGRFPPRFELPSLQGHVYTLDDFLGKVVLLNFWASWCVPCVDELPALQSLYSRLKDRGLVVVGIGIDDDENSLREFQQRFALTFPVLIDKDGTLKNRYRISGVPESFIIGKDGKLLMLPDPEGGQPAIKIVGPREWSAADVMSRFEGLLKE